MNYLQTRKESIEKEIAELRSEMNHLGDTPEDDRRYERKMRLSSILRTELSDIEDQIARVEKAAASEATVEITPEATAPEAVEEVAPEVEPHMNNLQILKAQIEEEITKAEKFAKTLWRSESSDSEVENAMGQLGGLRTALQLIRNQIAQAELDAYQSTVETTPEAVAVEAPVAINSTAKVAVSPVVAAHNAVMEEVVKIPGLKENATVYFYEDGTRVHFKDAYFRYDFTMVITERADGKINYRLEEQSTVPYSRRRRNKDLSSLASVIKFIAVAV